MQKNAEGPVCRFGAFVGGQREASPQPIIWAQSRGPKLWVLIRGLAVEVWSCSEQGFGPGSGLWDGYAWGTVDWDGGRGLWKEVRADAVKKGVTRTAT